MLFDVLFLMVLPAIFMLLSLSRSTLSVQEQMSGTFDQDGEPCTKSLSQGQSDGLVGYF